MWEYRRCIFSFFQYEVPYSHLKQPVMPSQSQTQHYHQGVGSGKSSSSSSNATQSSRGGMAGLSVPVLTTRYPPQGGSAEKMPPQQYHFHHYLNEYEA